MKKGDIVTIYNDLMTEESPEGQAKLVKFMGRDYDTELWQVKFLGCGAGEPLVERFIRKK